MVQPRERVTDQLEHIRPIILQTKEQKDFSQSSPLCFYLFRLNARLARSKVGASLPSEEPQKEYHFNIFNQD
jgi:hypothetical protein